MCSVFVFIHFPREWEGVWCGQRLAPKLRLLPGNIRLNCIVSKRRLFQTGINRLPKVLSPINLKTNKMAEQVCTLF